MANTWFNISGFVVGVLCLIMAGGMFVEYVFSISHYSFPTSIYTSPTIYDDLGPYWGYSDFRPADTMVEFTNINGTLDPDPTPVILLGWPFDDFSGAGLQYWLVQTEILRSVYIAAWALVYVCITASTESAKMTKLGSSASVGIFAFFTVVELGKLIVFIVAWTSKWWIATNPGNKSDVTGQFIIIFIATISSVVFTLISAILTCVINANNPFDAMPVQGQIGANAGYARPERVGLGPDGERYPTNATNVRKKKKRLKLDGHTS